MAADSVAPPANTPPAGYLWTNALSAGLTVRNYGEFVTNKPQAGPDGIQVAKVSDPSLNGITNLRYRGWDTDYSDQDRARVLLETRGGALLVPQRAVQELQNLYSVAIVDAGNKVAFRNVKVGPRVDTRWVIEEGLKPGERVVAEGLQSVRDGMTVHAKPFDESASVDAAAN